MPASPASLMRRIYYVTILLALIAGGVFILHTVRNGWAETQETMENLFLPEDTITIPTDFPLDVPVYDPTRITITLSGFDFSVGPKAHRLKYRVTQGTTFTTVADYYRRELKAKGWAAKDNTVSGGDYGVFDAEKNGFSLRVSLATQQAGVVVGLQYQSKSMVAVPPDGEGAEVPDSFPDFFPLHPDAGLFSYDVIAPSANETGGNRYKAYFQVSGTKATALELKAFYAEFLQDAGWKKIQEASAGKEYIAFTNGIRKLGLSIQPVSFHASGDGVAIDLYHVGMETGPMETTKPTPRVSDRAERSEDDEDFEPLHLPDFNDLPNGYGYGPAIRSLRQQGVLKGYPDGTFRPGNRVNRAEFLKTVVEALDDTEPAGKACFSDVKEEWFAPYACEAKERGIVEGYGDGTFRPGREVTYAEAVKIVMMAFSRINVDDPDGWQWYDRYLNAAERRGYLEGVESLRDDPDKPVTRGEMAQLIANLIAKETVPMFPFGDDTVKTLPANAPVVTHTPVPPLCPESDNPSVKSYVRVVSPKAGVTFTWGKTVPIQIEASADIRAVRVSIVDTTGKKHEIAYMGLICRGHFDWDPAADGRPLDATMLPWKGTILAEGADSIPNYSVSDASDGTFEIAEP